MTTTHTCDTATTAAKADSSEAAAPRRYPYVKYGVDPRTLRTEGNSRRTRDIRAERPGLVADVAAHGLDPRISMIAVAEEPDGALQVLVGFHRHAAAVTVKKHENPDLLIDVLVNAPGTTRKDALLTQGKENINRVGLTAAEEGDLYLQLELEGLDEAAIAENLHQPIERVRAGRAVASSPRTRTASDAMPNGDLLTMQTLAEFEDDEEVHEHLVECLRDYPEEFTYEVNQARGAKARRDKEIEVARELTERGYAVLDENEIPDTVEALTKLCHGDNADPLDSEQHASALAARPPSSSASR